MHEVLRRPNTCDLQEHGKGDTDGVGLARQPGVPRTQVLMRVGSQEIPAVLNVTRQQAEEAGLKVLGPVSAEHEQRMAGMSDVEMSDQEQGNGARTSGAKNASNKQALQDSNCSYNLNFGIVVENKSLHY